ncbi:MAG TPA: glycogen debranching protein GlgX [Pseudomonadales bacterium]
MKQPPVWLGRPYPLGATWDGEGVNFALFSSSADKVELCLYDETGRRETHRIVMPERTEQIWHCYLPQVRPGQLYGYRVYGPYDPPRGLRHNPHKLLLDPYAKMLSSPLIWRNAHFGYRVGAKGEDLVMDRRDNGPFMPKSVVVEDAFSWGDDRPPNTPWRDTVIYEVHVKGFTIRHPGVDPEVRGTYLGLASPPAIEHLKRLGVTAVELLPVHAHVDELHLVEKGLTNYWGYNTIGFFAPDMRFGVGDHVREFKEMVKRLHSAGIEVILDVVYNHTAEGNHLGPTFSFRGIDNAAYYRLVPDDPRRYLDYSGCGNSLNTMHARTLQLVMDSLRYWVREMHVDGFRFDLATVLARLDHEVSHRSSFFDILHQDPLLTQVKLIAEPWDMGEGGYHVGNFPVGWSEWNGQYRDTVRAYWRGDPGQLGDFARRLTGSADLYQDDGRSPQASINFVTAHDGFTLRDLVSYNEKHNEVNQEDNRDGHSHNLSWNCGVEGETDDPRIRCLRERQRRNLMATLLLSQGVPMLLAGDELSRTQRGNNNAYCQDNEISWLDWNLTDDERRFLAFTADLLRLRRAHPLFRRTTFFRGHHSDDDIMWLRPDGGEMTEAEWNDREGRVLGMLMNGEAVGDRDPMNQPIRDDTLLVLMSAQDADVLFRLPDRWGTGPWEVLVDTAEQREPGSAAEDPFRLAGRSLAVLVRRAPEWERRRD